MHTLSELEKIDILRERVGIGYGEAKQLLDACDGDVVEALVLYEERQAETDPKARLVASLERLVHQGNVTRLRVRKGEKTYLEIPVTAGVIGAALAPQLFVIAGLACLVGRCTVEFQRNEDGAEEAWHELIAEVAPATCKARLVPRCPTGTNFGPAG